MSTRIVLAVAVLAFTVAGGRAFAEGEGNGDPFAMRAAQRAGDGRAPVAETGPEAYPAISGGAVQPSSLARLEPAFDGEGVIQTAGTLPLGFSSRTLGQMQAQSVERAMAASEQARIVGTGTMHPWA